MTMRMGHRTILDVSWYEDIAFNLIQRSAKHSCSSVLCPHFPAALLYLNPMLLASAFATAAVNGDGELQKLLAFGVNNEEPEGATEKT